MLVFFTNLSPMEFQVRYLASFLLFSVIGNFEWFWMTTSQEYPVYGRVPQGSILGLTFFLLYINDLSDDVICDIAIDADDTTLYEKLWTKKRRGLLISMLGKLVSFDWSNNTGSIDVKMDGPVLEENSYFKMLRLIFSSKLDWYSYIISIAKTASKKNEP